MMRTRIERLAIPAALDAEGGDDFAQSAAVGNAVEHHLWGHDDFATDVEDRILMAQPTPEREYVLGVARAEGRIVGNARISIPLRDNLQAAYVQLEVLPGKRRQGIASALLAFAEQQLTLRGRTTIMSWSDARMGVDGDADADAGVAVVERLVPPTGAGWYPAADPAARLAVGRGFDLVQVDRQSVLHLAEVRSDRGRDTLLRQEAEARARGSEGYGLVRWVDRCPEDRVEDYALLRRRMSTDPPLGGFVQQEELWDAGRIRREEERSLAAGTSTLVEAVLHRESGRLVGHTILERFDSRPAVVYQEDTLVLDEHRGHRLGMWLKASNLRRAADSWTDAERIYTWNAEENSFMLEVNVALGFRPSGRTAGWQRVLT
jgi:GNAT superfamily N-acetyltransferase